MKLSYRRTFFVGLAFLSISAFWQLYDSIVPLILKYTFEIGDTLSGVVMSLDNVLALFLLPLFGMMSDKVNTRIGKRMPFILAGTAAAVVFMLLIPVADNSRSFALFIIALGLALVAMGTYRSPAVALMPDITPKPLRSKANAIINLMGAFGGIIALGLIKVLTSKTEKPNYLPLFATVAAIMAIAVIILIFTIKERKLSMAITEQTAEKESRDSEKGKLPKDVFLSLSFLLASISLWFMGYNAVTSAFSKYAQERLGVLGGDFTLPLLVATGAAILSYVPVGIVSSRLGRKKVILFGVALLALSFGASFFLTAITPMAYVIFVVVGISWASINVNSYPMVVEMCKGGDTGKYTGLYYTFSMSAQILTPILSGYLLEHVGYFTLFPYAAVCVALAFCTMLMVRHGDNRPPRAKGLEAYAD